MEIPFTNCEKTVVSRIGEQDSDESIGELPSVLKATTDGGWEDPRQLDWATSLARPNGSHVSNFAIEELD